MRLASTGIDDMDRAIALLEPIDDEGQQEFVRLFRSVDEDADVAVVGEVVACQANRSCRRAHGYLGPPSCPPDHTGAFQRPYHRGFRLYRDRSVSWRTSLGF